MESDERARLIEYLLKRQFKDRGWSWWLLTRPQPGTPIPPAEQVQRAKDGVEAAIVLRSVELEALPESELRSLHAAERIRELEVQLKDARTETKRLKQENTKLQSEMASSANEVPLSTKVKTTLLCIIGGLAKSSKFDISEPYKAGEVIENSLDQDSVKVSSHTIGDYLKLVPAAMESRST